MNRIGFKAYFFSAEERQDFNSSVIRITFQADEFGPQLNDVAAPVQIFDDDIDESQEEVFIIDLTSNSNNPNIQISRRSSLCKISDNDGKRIILFITPLKCGPHFRISLHRLI